VGGEVEGVSEDVQRRRTACWGRVQTGSGEIGLKKTVSALLLLDEIKKKVGEKRGAGNFPHIDHSKRRRTVRASAPRSEPGEPRGYLFRPKG